MATPYFLTDRQQDRLIYQAEARQISREAVIDLILDATVPQRREWTPEELDMLRNPLLPPREIARRTGRTRSAVSNARTKLAKAEGLTSLMYGPERTPKPPKGLPIYRERPGSDVPLRSAPVADERTGRVRQQYPSDKTDEICTFCDDAATAELVFDNGDEPQPVCPQHPK